MSKPAIRIAARLDQESADTLEVLKSLTGERNLSRLVKRALDAYRRELERGGSEPTPSEPTSPTRTTAPSDSENGAEFGAEEKVRVVTLPFDPVQGRFDNEYRRAGKR